VKLRLREKGVEVEENFPLCQTESESTLHCFMSCPFALSVWRLSSLDTLLTSCQASSFALVIKQVLAQGNLVQVKLFLILCWLIWSARNDKVWRDKENDPPQVVAHGSKYLAEIEACHRQFAPSMAPRSQQPERWTPPPPGTLKLNVDGALFSQSPRAGVGAIVRDETGALVRYMTNKFTSCRNPLVVETARIKGSTSVDLKVQLQELMGGIRLPSSGTCIAGRRDRESR